MCTCLARTDGERECSPNDVPSLLHIFGARCPSGHLFCSTRCDFSALFRLIHWLLTDCFNECLIIKVSMEEIRKVVDREVWRFAYERLLIFSWSHFFWVNYWIFLERTQLFSYCDIYPVLDYIIVHIQIRHSSFPIVLEACETLKPWENSTLYCTRDINISISPQFVFEFMQIQRLLWVL